MTATNEQLADLDQLYIDAFQSIHQINATLAARTQNQGAESRVLLKAAFDTIITNLNAFRNFDK